MVDKRKKTKEKFSLIQRVTEKATTEEAHGVYTFTLSGLANKKEIAARVRQDFKVTPIKIHIVNLPKKSVTIMGRRGTRGGAVKALVYLKHGDKITHSVPIKK